MWNSVDEMVRELGLPAAPDNIEAVEKALKRQLAMVHPDTTGGQFASDGQETRFHRIREGLEFLKRDISGPPALRVTDLQKNVQATVLALRQVHLQEEHTRAEMLDTVLLGLRRANSLPRITSATLFAVSTAVFTFGSAVKEHPRVQDAFAVSGTDVAVGRSLVNERRLFCIAMAT